MTSLPRGRALSPASLLLALLVVVAALVATPSPARADGDGFTGPLRVGGTLSYQSPYENFAHYASLDDCQAKRSGFLGIVPTLGQGLLGRYIRAIADPSVSVAGSCEGPIAPGVFNDPRVTGTYQGGKLLVGSVSLNEALNAAQGGTSVTTVEWFRNGTPVFQAPEGGNRPISSPSSWNNSVAYTPTESGDYTVRVGLKLNAYNNGLTTQSAPIKVTLNVTGTGPSITQAGTGEITRGSALKAGSSAAPTPSDATLERSYWTRNGSPIAGSESTKPLAENTYTVTAEDEGQALRLVGVYGKTGYTSGTLTSTNAITPLRTYTPAPSAAIVGTPRVGAPTSVALSGGNPSFASNEVTYRWYTVEAGGARTPITGATSATFTPTTEQFDQAISATVTPKRTGWVTTPFDTAPVTVGKGELAGRTASISGAAQVGQPLNASFASTPAASTTTYQWLRSTTTQDQGTAIAGATASSYTPRAADLDRYLRVQVSTSGTYGYEDSVTVSGPTGLIGKGTFSVAAPLLTGPFKVDEPATAQLPSAAGLPEDWTVTHQWGTQVGVGHDRTCSLTPGAVYPDAGLGAPTYSPAAQLQGTTLCVRTLAQAPGYLDATSFAYAGTVTDKGDIKNLSVTLPESSVATQPITPGTPAPTPSTVQRDYQWYVVAGRARTPIDGATTASYTPPAWMREKTLLLEVTATDPHYYSATASDTVYVTPASVELPRIALTTDPVVGRPAIVKVTGTAVPTSADLAWQWYVNAVPVPGATTTSYTPTAEDAGKSLSVGLTGTAEYYDTTRAVSGSRVVGAAGAQDLAVRSDDEPTVGSPVRLVVTGGAVAGAELTYRWYLDGAFAARDTSRYTPRTTDVGKRLSIRVTAAQPGHQPVTTTADLGAVQPATATGLRITITGKPQVGRLLTGRLVGTPDDARGGVDAYRWQADGKNIPHAVRPTYRPTKRYQGATLTLIITTRWTGYQPTLTTSTGVGPVKGRRR